MEYTDIPTPFPIPFADSAGVGYIRTVPTDSQIGVTPGAASLTDGFPPLNATALDAGGYPPDIQDMNGIIKAITMAIRWAQAGGLPIYNSDFATAIGGYPKGAVLMRTSFGGGFWSNDTDNNSTDPDAGGAGWRPYSFFGIASVSVTTADITLTMDQYGAPIISMTGVLTGNRSVIMPILSGRWVIVNSCTGNYTVTVKTAAGTGVTLYPGQMMPVWGDGSNINAYSRTPTPASGFVRVSPSEYSKPVSGYAFTGLTSGANTTIAAPAKNATALRIAFNGFISATGSAGDKVSYVQAAPTSAFSSFFYILNMTAYEPSGIPAGHGLAYANPELIIPLDAIGGNVYLKYTKTTSTDSCSYDVRGYLTN